VAVASGWMEDGKWMNLKATEAKMMQKKKKSVKHKFVCYTKKGIKRSSRVLGVEGHQDYVFHFHTERL
jgi:hypothetical protein